LRASIASSSAAPTVAAASILSRAVGRAHATGTASSGAPSTPSARA
jgi:hypothetical protein